MTPKDSVGKPVERQRRKAMRKQVLALHGEGKSYRQIMAITGLKSTSNVAHYVKDEHLHKLDENNVCTHCHKQHYECEVIGFVHAWQEVENNIVLTSMPPQFPPRERVCLNCGKREVLRLKQPEVKEWEQKV